MPLNQQQKQAAAFYVKGVCNVLRDATPEQAAQILKRITVGLPITVDVSTGEHDASHRIFGTVIDVQPSYQSADELARPDKVMVLIKEVHRNF